MKLKVMNFGKYNVSYVAWRINKIKSKILARLWILKGATVGRNVIIYGKPVVVGPFSNLKIGDNTTINHGVLLNCYSGIEIESDVTLSAYSQIHTSSLDIKNLQNKMHVEKDILIQKGAWVAAAAIILPGSRLGQYSVVGAGEKFTGALPEHHIFNDGIISKIEVRYVHASC